MKVFIGKTFETLIFNQNLFVIIQKAAADHAAALVKNINRDSDFLVLWQLSNQFLGFE